MLNFGTTVSFSKDAAKILNGLTEAVTKLAAATEKDVASNERLAGSVDKLTEALDQITKPNPIIIVVSGESIHIPGLREFQGEDMSFTVPRDHQDEPFTLDPITAQDSEGPVEIVFTERLESSDPTVVDIVESSFHFGTFGGATVNRIVTYQGNDFIVSSVVFNVTPGAITFAGGGIQVPGLTPDPEV